LTKKQKAVLDYLTSFQSKRGYSPTMAEIAKKFKFSSVGTVAQYIDALIEKGYIQRDKGRARSIEIAVPEKENSAPEKPGVKKALPKKVQEEEPELPPAIDIIEWGLQKISTVKVPLFENVASCGLPDLTEANIEDYIEIDTRIAKPGSSYFLVRASGDSMNQAGINDGDFVLVRVQNHADIGQKVVACIDDGVTIKELQYRGPFVVLMPRSDNPEHKPIVLSGNPLIQGVVIATIPKF